MCVFQWIRELGSRPLVMCVCVFQWIRELGSWPATSDMWSGTWDESNFYLETSLARFYSQLITPLFLMAVSPDEKNNTVNRLKVVWHALVANIFTRR